MNFFSFDVPSVLGSGGAKFVPGFFIKYTVHVCKTPVAASPQMSSESQTALIEQPLVTSFDTARVAASTVLTITDSVRVTPTEDSMYTLFLFELTGRSARKFLFLVKRLAKVTSYSLVWLISILLFVVRRNVFFVLFIFSITSSNSFWNSVECRSVLSVATSSARQSLDFSSNTLSFSSYNQGCSSESV